MMMRSSVLQRQQVNVLGSGMSNYERMDEESFSDSADGAPVTDSISALESCPDSNGANLQAQGQTDQTENQTEKTVSFHSPAVLPTSSPAVISVTTAGQAKMSTVKTSAQIRLENEKSNYNSMDKDSGSSEPKKSSVIRRFKDPAGDRFIKRDNPKDHCQSQVVRAVDHIIFRLVTLVLIIIDLAIVITSLTIAFGDNAYEKRNTVLILDIIALTFSCYFMMEVSLRIFAQSPKVFFRQPLEILDFLVVVLAFIIIVVDLSLENNSISPAKTVTAFRGVRIVRIFMLCRAMTQRKHLARSSRLLVSENKRRFQKDGFDLDLCYVTENMIAMSFPSQGVMSIYRNPIEEVSRFFNTKYPEHYRIYNCCSEREYNGDKYFQNCVKRIMIDDHNVPSLQEMIDFAADVKQWMSEDRQNVISIHCKGGKGRTGTMVCVWLLHSEAFSTAEDALDYFASRRTDLSVGKKYQGVETPSQSRYVKYFEIMKIQYDGQVPPTVRLRINKISVSALKGIGNGDGRDLIVKLIVRGEVIFEAKFGTNTNCTTLFERETQTITASLVNSPILAGDVKVRFEATTDIPRDYDDCPWYFWFNTSFIEHDELSLGREELDNPHKEKTWKLYRETFKVTLGFEQA